uniref:Uncharacterized protein n=1 Tax=Arundo donax TaxID=35708 RepID=A0A0A9D3Y6_ARUDO
MLIFLLSSIVSYLLFLWTWYIPKISFDLFGINSWDQVALSFIFLDRYLSLLTFVSHFTGRSQEFFILRHKIPDVTNKSTCFHRGIFSQTL